jgi:hypothetical protein
VFKLVPHGLQKEPAPVWFETIDLPDNLARQCDGDAFGDSHGLTQSMIILDQIRN